MNTTNTQSVCQKDAKARPRGNTRKGVDRDTCLKKVHVANHGSTDIFLVRKVREKKDSEKKAS